MVLFRKATVNLSENELRATVQEDLNSYLMLRRAADDLVREFSQSGLLERRVDNLQPAERKQIRALWRDGVMAFLEFDFLKEKYRGFYQIDYVAEPELHANAFMLAYMAYVTQYDACLQIVGMIGDNDFMETLLNEAGEGIPSDSYFVMKQRLTNPNVMLRMNTGAAYRELIRKDVSIDAGIIADFDLRKNHFYRSLGTHADIFIDNPLDQLERTAFETILPIQKKVAVRMSYIRTARRDYLITPEILAGCRSRLSPGDILIQRRNWHMTNIGIPGFWPHVALYVGTPEELENYFGEMDADVLKKIKEQYPAVWTQLNTSAPDGYPRCVIESIRPGVVLQSLETSAKCDYLAVIRPNLSKKEKLAALMAAFSHYGKPYDLNFDFTTDNELVCSELVYKAYKVAADLPLVPEVINGRLLLPPNRLAETSVKNMGKDGAFSFVLFLDAIERRDVVVERDQAAFCQSWQRPKWDVMQQ
ncbi:MAG: hypothetical protein JXR25_01345 [Pontiellaceae bacterium]|nr:hypothetical protein [Pontiellaceae bacterium]MBN2783444.1 hypothetical protein [Pontiellaceae bacterium]